MTFSSSPKSIVVWECDRDKEFAPLKNAKGAPDFTPTACRNTLLALHQNWLRMAGTCLVDSNGQKACPRRRRQSAEGTGHQ
jgi:hypothetical protein